MTETDLTPSKARHLHRFYRAFLALSGSKRVVDKYPELLFRNGLVDLAFPQACKIVIIRNGADICRSIETWSSKNGTSQADWWGRDGQKWDLLVDQLIRPDPHFAPLIPVLGQLDAQVDRAAVEWIVSMRQALDLQSTAAGALYFIRYEDLVANPEQQMKDLLKFCNLADDPVVIRYAKSQAPEEFASLMESLGRRVDSLACVAVNHQSLNPVVRDLQEKGVPVFSLLNDFAQGIRRNYVGSNNVKIGRIAAWMISKTVKQPGSWPSSLGATAGMDMT